MADSVDNLEDTTTPAGEAAQTGVPARNKAKTARRANLNNTVSLTADRHRPRQDEPWPLQSTASSMNTLVIARAAWSHATVLRTCRALNARPSGEIIGRYREATLESKSQRAA